MKRIALLCSITLSIAPFVLSQQLSSERSTASCALTRGGSVATNSIGRFTSGCYVEASAISDTAGRGNKQFGVAPVITSFTPTSGPVGKKVSIRGTGFIGTTKVTFGGVEATRFIVNTDKLVNAAVPSGAKSGKIAITTPGGTAFSPETFTVISGGCTPAGQQCDPLLPPCCPGLHCQLIGDRAFCEGFSKNSPTTNSSLDPLNEHALVY
jgi:hypothetical protein